MLLELQFILTHYKGRNLQFQLLQVALRRNLFLFQVYTKGNIHLLHPCNVALQMLDYLLSVNILGRHLAEQADQFLGDLHWLLSHLVSPHQLYLHVEEFLSEWDFPEGLLAISLFRYFSLRHDLKANDPHRVHVGLYGDSALLIEASVLVVIFLPSVARLHHAFLLFRIAIFAQVIFGPEVNQKGFFASHNDVASLQVIMPPASAVKQMQLLHDPQQHHRFSGHALLSCPIEHGGPLLDHGADLDYFTGAYLDVETLKVIDDSVLLVKVVRHSIVPLQTHSNLLDDEPPPLIVSPDGQIVGLLGLRRLSLLVLQGINFLQAPEKLFPSGLLPYH